MSADALLRWKAQILDYQQRVRETKPVQQATLFDLAPVHCDPETIDPFTLHLQPMAFYRMPDDFGQAALYFVIDSAASYYFILAKPVVVTNAGVGLMAVKITSAVTKTYIIAIR